jgi:hypothetical protein
LSEFITQSGRAEIRLLIIQQLAAKARTLLVLHTAFEPNLLLPQTAGRCGVANSDGRVKTITQTRFERVHMIARLASSALLNAWALLLLLFGAAIVSPVHASLILGGTATGQGAGIGSSNIVLTIQKNPTEQGCISWNGTVDVIGSAACTLGLSPAISGGDEKTGSSQTQTRTVSQAGVESGQSLVIVLNIGEPAGNLFTIENLSLTIYSPTGAILFNTGDLLGAGTPPGGGVTENSSLQTFGILGFGFLLDSAEAAALSPFICTNGLISGCSGIANPANANNRIGLAALLTNVAGSNETFSIADSLNVRITAIGSVPEPPTSLIVATGLGLFGLTRRLRKAVSRGVV